MSGRERPMIFSAPMIRALLDGQKTQTRRVFVPPTPYAPDDDITVELATGSIKPRFAVGDRLWVRESHQINAFGSHPNWTAEHVIYAADDACVEMRPPVPFVGKCDIGLRGWRSPIHMPRWASRLTLTVTDVRVQRVQDISEADAEAEGCDCQIWDQALAVRNYGRPDGWFCMWGGPDSYTRPDVYVDQDEIWRASYRTLWNSLHGPGAWDANPWVVAISFEPVPTPTTAAHGATP